MDNSNDMPEKLDLEDLTYISGGSVHPVDQNKTKWVVIDDKTGNVVASFAGSNAEKQAREFAKQLGLE